jgi:hypothetical protein
MYLIYPDRAEPDAYERTLPEVFPGTAPGSFTEVPGLGWVWTSQSADAEIIARAGLSQPGHVHSSSGHLDISGGRIELPPWGFIWLTGS